jgi:hypothetical protein
MERIGDAVERELARGGGRDALPLGRVSAVWPDAVGDAIARSAWPRRLGRDGTLHVATVSATWATELTLLADQLLARLADQLGDEAPTSLRCAVGPVPEPSSPESEAEVTIPPEASPEVAATAASVASAIEDRDLRELVARAARASLGRGASDRHF